MKTVITSNSTTINEAIGTTVAARLFSQDETVTEGVSDGVAVRLDCIDTGEATTSEEFGRTPESK